MQQISDYELVLMKIIWDNGGKALYAEIARALENKDTPWTKNTIITLTSRLVGKGYLKTNKIGRRNEYKALISAEEYQQCQAEVFINKVYEGNAKGLVASLIQKDLLSSKDYEELKKYWEGGGSL